MKQLAFEFAAPALPTLNNFVVGGNAELVQRLQSLTPRAGERFLYLWGAAGSGRTHLLRSALAQLADARCKVAYLACDAMLAHPLEEADAIAVDDVDRLDDAAQIALFNLYNRLRESGGTLLAAGDAPPAQLQLRPDLVTRLAWGLVYQVRGLSDAEKADALAEHASLRGFGLQPEVGQYLLSHVQRDMRTLIAMLDALDRYSREAKRPITVPLVRELLATSK